MDLEQIRKQIDAVDSELLMLINKRMELVVRTGKLKTDIADPQREEAVLGRVTNQSRGLLTPDFSASLFKQLMEQARILQEEKAQLIGFQGEHGAFSEIAAKQFSAGGVSLPHATFSDVFEGVQSGILDYGIVPIENSLGGAVSEVDDLLMSTSLHIVGEVSLPIHHCLITLPDSDYRDIRVVYSHPQALSQCKGFLKRNKLEARTYYDTAGSALMLSKERPVSTAVIASRLAAELYNLDVVKENIEDNNLNVTRFVILSKNPAAKSGDKCTVFFALNHKPGSLFNVIKLFSDAGVNLTRIESKPTPQHPGSYAFLVDFVGSSEDTKVKTTLESVASEAAAFRLLGCYSKVD
jgi:prephenate dehydratase/chorismate mutase